MKSENVKTKEDYSFLKGVFTATNPGKETRFALCAILISLLVLAVLLVAAIYFLDIKISLNGSQALTGLTGGCIYKICRSFKKAKAIQPP